MAQYFKYKSLEGTSLKYFIQMLLDEKIYASTFDQLNDPMEGAYLANTIIADEIKEHNKGAKLEKRIVSLVRKEREELPINMLMWSHYSDEHRGCCIEFHFQNQEDEDCVQSISYIDTIPEDNQANKNIDNLLIRKFCDWAYEHEVRYLGPKKFVPIKIDKIYLGMKIDSLYEDEEKTNEEFYRNLITRLCPNAQVEIMKAEDFDDNHINTGTNL